MCQLYYFAFNWTLDWNWTLKLKLKLKPVWACLVLLGSAMLEALESHHNEKLLRNSIKKLLKGILSTVILKNNNK